MKRLGAAFLLTVFIFNSVGPFLKFILLHQKIIHQMQRRIFCHDEKELYAITVTPENAPLIHWHDQHEFSYHEAMFDVVEKEVVDEHTIVYHCIADNDETRLFADLDHFIKKEHSHKGQFKIPKVQLFQVYLPEKPIHTRLPLADCEDKIRKQWLYQLHYLAPILSTNSPPPEAIS